MYVFFSPAVSYFEAYPHLFCTCPLSLLTKPQVVLTGCDSATRVYYTYSYSHHRPLHAQSRCVKLRNLPY